MTWGVPLLVSFCLFILFMGFSRQEYWSGLPLPSPVKTLESPLDCKEIKPVNPKGNWSWIFIGRTDAEAEAPLLWPPVAKIWFIVNYSDVGTAWRQEDKGIVEDEMFEWHHWLDGHEFEQVLRVGDKTGRPGVMQSMGSQRVRHDWATELN